MRSVEFEVPGKASYTKKEMIKHVTQIASDEYGIEIDVSGLDLQQYYRSDGAKITKSLASILRSKIPKETVQTNFGSFARRVSELYTVGLSLRAEFGNKKLLGEGIYESGKTCLRKDGENATSKFFIVNNRRCETIVLYEKGKKDAGARCIAYFAGNRNIYLTNFYWRNLTQNKLYFITAVRHLLGIRKVMYRQNPKFFLPIFKNGDSVLVYDERTRPVIPTKKLSCPHCGVMVPEDKLYTEEFGSYRLVGCTKKCARGHSKVYVQCDGCMEHVQSGGASQVKDKHYCQRCVRMFMVTCSVCGGTSRKDDCKAIGGDILCKRCQKLSKCTVCKKVITNSADSRSVGDLVCCISCLPKSGHLCLVCHTIYNTEITSKIINGTSFPICDDCVNPLPGTLMEARGKTAETR